MLAVPHHRSRYTRIFIRQLCKQYSTCTSIVTQNHVSLTFYKLLSVYSNKKSIQFIILVVERLENKPIDGELLHWSGRLASRDAKGRLASRGGDQQGGEERAFGRLVRGSRGRSRRAERLLKKSAREARARRELLVGEEQRIGEGAGESEAAEKTASACVGGSVERGRWGLRGRWSRNRRISAMPTRFRSASLFARCEARSGRTSVSASHRRARLGSSTCGSASNWLPPTGAARAGAAGA